MKEITDPNELKSKKRFSWPSKTNELKLKKRFSWPSKINERGDGGTEIEDIGGRVCG